MIQIVNLKINDINLRKAHLRDRLLIYYWFNDKDSIRYKIKTKHKILLHQHNIWYTNFLRQNKSFLWIIQFEKYDIGSIRASFLKKKGI